MMDLGFRAPNPPNRGANWETLQPGYDCSALRAGDLAGGQTNCPKLLLREVYGNPWNHQSPITVSAASSGMQTRAAIFSSEGLKPRWAMTTRFDCSPVCDSPTQL
jgi:hypothetical protein